MLKFFTDNHPKAPYSSFHEREGFSLLALHFDNGLNTLFFRLDYQFSSKSFHFLKVSLSSLLLIRFQVQAILKFMKWKLFYSCSELRTHCSSSVILHLVTDHWSLQKEFNFSLILRWLTLKTFLLNSLDLLDQ